MQSPYHIHYSGYTLDQLRPLLHLILTCCYDRQPHHAVLYRQQYEDDSKTDAKTHRKNDYEEAWETIEKKISSKFALPWE
jgi:G2/mitotic-specific cyclin 3/4